MCVQVEMSGVYNVYLVTEDDAASKEWSDWNNPSNSRITKWYNQNGEECTKFFTLQLQRNEQIVLSDQRVPTNLIFTGYDINEAQEVTQNGTIIELFGYYRLEGDRDNFGRVQRFVAGEMMNLMASFDIIKYIEYGDAIKVQEVDTGGEVGTFVLKMTSSNASRCVREWKNTSESFKALQKGQNRYFDYDSFPLESHFRLSLRLRPE